MREAIEIGEVAAGEERWDDAAKYYRIAAKYAQEEGDLDKARALLLKSYEFKKLIEK